MGLPVGRWFDGYARSHSDFEVELVDLAELGLPFVDEPRSTRRRPDAPIGSTNWNRRSPGGGYVRHDI